MKRHNSIPMTFREWLWKKEKAKIIYVFANLFILLFGFPSYSGEWQWVNIHESMIEEYGTNGNYLMAAISILIILSNIITLYICDANYQSYCDHFYDRYDANKKNKK
jgi:hypothetical protein